MLPADLDFYTGFIRLDLHLQLELHFICNPDVYRHAAALQTQAIVAFERISEGTQSFGSGFTAESFLFFDFQYVHCVYFRAIQCDMLIIAADCGQWSLQRL